MAIVGMFVLIAVVSFVLLGEIRRVHRLLDESIQAHHRSIAKIPELESQVRTLTKKLDALQ